MSKKTNREKFVIEYINYLPEDMVDYEIREYIPEEYFIFTNKEYYNKFHHLLKPRIQKYEQYLNNIVKRDYYFIFATIMKENIDVWLKMKDIIYKNTSYLNYVYYMIDYCNEHESVECRNILIKYLKELGLCQNQHKKNVSRSIVWKK
jgi:hypothetical protein